MQNYSQGPELPDIGYPFYPILPYLRFLPYNRLMNPLEITFVYPKGYFYVSYFQLIETKRNEPLNRTRR